MALYEHVFIARQDLSNAQAEGLIEHFGQVLTDNGGEMKGTEYWGLRTMAYKINKNRKGHYGYMKSDSPSAAVQEMDGGDTSDLVEGLIEREDCEFSVQGKGGAALQYLVLIPRMASQLKRMNRAKGVSFLSFHFASARSTARFDSWVNPPRNSKSLAACMTRKGCSEAN